MVRKILFFLFVIATINVAAQPNGGFSYQAIIRNSNNQLVVNHVVGTRVSILKGSTSGNAIYSEFHLASTDRNGLLTLEIGTGMVQGGSFASINWAMGPYFIKIETDPTGGTNYLFISVSQLLTVPYSLHANVADSISGGVVEQDPIFIASVAKGITTSDTAYWQGKLDFEVDASLTNELQMIGISHDTIFLSNGGYAVLPSEQDPVFSSSFSWGISSQDTARWNNKQNKIIPGDGLSFQNDTLTVNLTGQHFVGEFFGGGIVVYLDHTGQHGLVMAVSDVCTCAWSNLNGTLNGSTNIWNGDSNTIAIMNQTGHVNSAAKSCYDYVNPDMGTGVFTDWYMPSIMEMYLTGKYYFLIQKVLYTDGNTSTTPLGGSYFSSSEYSLGEAYTCAYSNFGIGVQSKHWTYKVRAFRAF